MSKQRRRHPPRPRKPAEFARKVQWDPAALLYPAPVLLVSCQGSAPRPNLITIAWAGTVCSDPPSIQIAVRPERYSYGLIKESGEFVANVPSSQRVRAVDFCGVRSGRDMDKFAEAGLTPAPAKELAAPLIAECPLSLECRVVKTVELGSHTMFIGQIVAVHAAADLIDPKGRFALERASLLAYAHGHYYVLGKQLGRFGFSVKKKPEKTAEKKPKRRT